MDSNMDDKVVQLLKQFDILLTEIVLLSLQDMRLIVGEISQKLEEIKVEIAEGGVHCSGPPPPFLAEFDSTTFASENTNDKSEIVVVLEADNLKIENCVERFDVGGVNSEDLSCLYVLSECEPAANTATAVEIGDNETLVQCEVVFNSEDDDESRPGSDDDVIADDTLNNESDGSDVTHNEEEDGSKRRALERVCQQCGEEFDTKRALTSHVMHVHPERAVDIISCTACGKQFRSLNGLKYHTETKHSAAAVGGGGAERYLCERLDCTYQTGSRVLLRAHRYSHAVNAPLTCPVCSKNFLGESTVC